MCRKSLLLLSLCFSLHSLLAQRTLTLVEAISTAQAQSVEAKLAENIRENRFFLYQTYLANLRPQLSFQGGLPTYSRSVLDVRQPDGEIRFIPVRQNNSYLGFSLTQNLPLTGGRISFNSDLTRFDDYTEEIRAYSATPFNIRLDQPLFGFNEFKWQRKIEPLKLQESQKDYKFRMEEIALQTIRLFFDVIDAQQDLRIAEINLSNNTLIREIEEKRIALGTTTREKILQIELQILRASQAQKKAAVELRTGLLILKTQLGLQEEDSLQLSIPAALPPQNMDEASAFREAQENRPEYVSFERRRLEAERDLNQARTSRNQVNLSASLGFNGAGSQFDAAFDPLLNQQRFSIGVNVPILDWGRNKAQRGIAEANQKVVDYTIAQEELNLRREISAHINNIDLLRANISIAERTDAIGAERYQLALEQYRLGKVSVTDLNVALVEKDEARRAYFSALRTFWETYYSLRKMTLYDLERGGKL
jgi:outer membrane protein TolC